MSGFVTSEIKDRAYDALEKENTKLNEQIEVLSAKLADKNLMCGDMEVLINELKAENKILKAQMDVVRMIFEGRGRK